MVLPNLPGFLAAAFSILPTMTVLYFMLRRYDRFFVERRLLFALLVGLLAGAAVTLVQVLFAGFHEGPYLATTAPHISLVMLVVSYPLVETAGKLVCVNWRTYQGRRDTPYYAAAIGLGFAAINVFIVVGRGVAGFVAAEAAQFSHAALVLFAVLAAILFTGGIMIHGFSAVVMGRAVAQRDPIRAFFYGIMLLVPYYVGYWAMFAIRQETILVVVFPVVVFLYGLLGVRYAIRHILEEVVPARERRRLLREMEKEGRDAPKIPD